MLFYKLYTVSIQLTLFRGIFRHERVNQNAFLSLALDCYNVVDSVGCCFGADLIMDYRV